jgi:cytoskeletal protein RodZ
MTWSGIGKFLLGIILAIAILIGGSAVLALYFMYKVTTPPPKPVFANETVPAKAQTPPTTKPTQPTPSPAAQSTQPTSVESSSANPLEPGEYIARVNWPQGLILRSEPNLEAERTGGLENDQRIVVLEESADKKWQRVRLEDGEQEGWIKAGNIERVQE